MAVNVPSNGDQLKQYLIPLVPTSGVSGRQPFSGQLFKETPGWSVECNATRVRTGHRCEESVHSGKTEDLWQMTTPSAERRIKVRLPLRLPVCLHMVNGSPGINSFTENISGDGLYCISPIRFVPRESLTADVWLPAAGPARCGAVIRCKVRVMRSDALVVGGGFGIGCRIETYT